MKKSIIVFVATLTSIMFVACGKETCSAEGCKNDAVEYGLCDVHLAIIKQEAVNDTEQIEPSTESGQTEEVVEADKAEPSEEVEIPKQESAKADNSGEVLEEHDGVAVVDTFFYMRGEDRGRYFLVFENHNDYDVRIDATGIARDNSGGVVSSRDDVILVLGPNRQMVAGIYLDDVSEDNQLEYQYTVKEESRLHDFSDNVTCNVTNNGNKINLEITNNGDVELDNVMPYALYFKDGKIFSHEYTGYQKIEPGKTIFVEVPCGDGEFDDFKLYMIAGGKK